MNPDNPQPIIQAHAYPDGEEFVTECFHLPVSVSAGSLDQAVTDLDQAIQQYLKERRDEWDEELNVEVLLVFYLGPLSFDDT